MRIDGYVFGLFILPCSAWTPIPGTVTPSWARCTSGTSVFRNTAANNVPNTYKYNVKLSRRSLVKRMSLQYSFVNLLLLPANAVYEG